MEKFRIGLYGLAQVTAITYGVLVAGAAIKFANAAHIDGDPFPDAYYRAMFYRDHGYFLLALVIIWAVSMAYSSSQWSQWKIGEGWINATGIALTLLFIIMGTYLGFGATAQPPHLITAIK